MKASDLFVKCLEAEGVEYIFGVPGEENADFMMSLEASDRIRAVDPLAEHPQKVRQIPDQLHRRVVMGIHLRRQEVGMHDPLVRIRVPQPRVVLDHVEAERDHEIGLVDGEVDPVPGADRPQKALADARAVMGPEDILLSDVGAHKMWIARHYHCHAPNTCLIPNGFCSMGFALPGAIAANLVHPERRVLAVCGDAGFMMNVQEMETARRLGSRFTAMVWEDREYGLIAWKQESTFGRHTDLSFGNPDWLKLADAFGWNGHYCEDSRDLRDVLELSFTEPGPSLVVIPIDYRENRLLTQKLGEITATL